MTEWVDRPKEDKKKLSYKLREIEDMVRRASHVVSGNAIEDRLTGIQGKLYDCIKFVRGDNYDG